MKRRLTALFLTLAMCSALLLTACGGNNDTPPANNGGDQQTTQPSGGDAETPTNNPAKTTLVIRIDGDYAVLLSDEGIENPVARALLPMEIEEGSRLLCEMFSYRLL